jgi:hypothetical protein
MRGQPASSIETMSDYASPPDAETQSSSPWIPRTATEKEAVREQVGRILSSTLFRNSKRFPAFLQHTVEHALTSNNGLKERTIGHEVFGRDPGYDTAQDPAVRMTAAEVRKRLAQYYQSPEHAAETVITYPSGSYVPEFFAPLTPPVADAQVSPDDPEPEHQRGYRGRLSALLIGGAVTLAAVLVALAVARTRDTRSVDAVDRFWAPIVNASSPVLLCIGDPFSPRSRPEPGNEPAVPGRRDMTIDEFLRSNSVRYTDSVTLALLAGELRARDKPFRIRRPAATELQDLRDGPVVLIGGFNNPWAVRLGGGLRFTLASDHDGSYIRDQDHPDSRDWHSGRRLKDLTESYGLITRVQNPATGHSVVTVSGLVLGTRAAAECTLDAACLSSAEQLRAGDWEHRNVQIVVATKVIGEDSGAPRVVAAHLW